MWTIRPPSLMCAADDSSSSGGRGGGGGRALRNEGGEGKRQTSDVRTSVTSRPTI